MFPTQDLLLTTTAQKEIIPELKMIPSAGKQIIPVSGNFSIRFGDNTCHYSLNSGYCFHIVDFREKVPAVCCEIRYQ